MRPLVRSIVPWLGALCAALPAGAQCELQRITLPQPFPEDHFGSAVALGGGLALVGAPGDDVAGGGSGAAYALVRTGAGWQFEATLIGSASAGNQSFGRSVALSGERGLIGAPGDDHAGIDAGSAYVFERGVAGWSEKALLRASDATPEDGFGNAVALSGNRALVGAWQSDAAGINSGAAYVFERQPGGWVEVQQLLPGDLAAGDLLGRSVALAGDTALVSAPWDDDLGFSSGAVYVFERDAGGWVETQKLLGSDTDDQHYFGWALALEGDRALSTALFANASRGAAYVFERGPGDFVETARLTAADGAWNDRFGQSVALSGERALVGAFLDDDLDTDSGAAYLFERDGSSWIEVVKLHASDGGYTDQLGDEVALDGREALVSAPQAGDVWRQGHVYAFYPPEVGAPFCFCDAAPCGNPDPVAGCANSSGGGARLAACGSPSVGADDLVIAATNLRPGQFALVFMGDGETHSPLGDGLRCTSGGALGQFRFPARPTGAAGLLLEGPGLVAFTHASFPPPGRIQAGQTWNFQCWYRDPLGPCGSSFNLSNAVSVDFGP